MKFNQRLRGTSKICQQSNTKNKFKKHKKEARYADKDYTFLWVYSFDYTVAHTAPYKVVFN